MAVNYAHLAFVHRLVTNCYSCGHHSGARKVLEELGGTNYLQEAISTTPDNDELYKGYLANLSFVWWRLTGETQARDWAKVIWEQAAKGEHWVHPTHMLAYLALMDDATPQSEVRALIERLRLVRQHTRDVERATRLAELAERLAQKLWGCQQ